MYVMCHVVCVCVFVLYMSACVCVYMHACGHALKVHAYINHRQIMGLLLTLIGQAMERDLSKNQKDKSDCYGNIEPKDLTYTGLFFAAVGVLGYCVLVVGLRNPKYKRVEAERSKNVSDNPTK